MLNPEKSNTATCVHFGESPFSSRISSRTPVA